MTNAKKTQKSVLRHLAIILDGNRRWAKARGLKTMQGHYKGYQKLKEVSDWCIESGITVLTVYAFSTENWNRSKGEVSYLMDLIRRLLREEEKEFMKRGVRVKLVGDRAMLYKDIQEMFSHIEEVTKENKNLTLQLAISYGGRREIACAFQSLCREYSKRGKNPEDISEDEISRHLWTAGVSDPDVILRTGGEKRLSNFLPWQAVYSELIFLDQEWPAFSRDDFTAVLAEFKNRQRRFGR